MKGGGEKYASMCRVSSDEQRHLTSALCPALGNDQAVKFYYYRRSSVSASGKVKRGRRNYTFCAQGPRCTRQSFIGQ